MGLGDNPVTRRKAYRDLFLYELDKGLVDEIRQSTNGNYALGCERFQKEVEEALGRRASKGIPGRPRKADVRD